MQARPLNLDLRQRCRGAASRPAQAAALSMPVTKTATVSSSLPWLGLRSTSSPSRAEAVLLNRTGASLGFSGAPDDWKSFGAEAP
jgi:hypothetical protein